MSLPSLDDVSVDDRGGRLRRRMAECPVCQLATEYHERIAEARQRGWGAAKIHAYLTVCGAGVSKQDVIRHVTLHLSPEGLCLLASRQDSTSSSKRRPLAKSPSTMKKTAG